MAEPFVTRVIQDFLENGCGAESQKFGTKRKELVKGVLFRGAYYWAVTNYWTLSH